MKAVILAGGLGTRLSEETKIKPKPLVEIGGKPILWHIMKIYSHYGVNDFIICAGYKGHMIEEYFQNNPESNWKILIEDTGKDTMTGGRLGRLKNHLKDEQSFCFTYGDGVANVNIQELVAFHKLHGKLATMTTSFPPERFGRVVLDGDAVISFREKPSNDTTRVNAGFFVLNPEVLNLLESDQTVWELDPLLSLTQKNELMAFRHDDFWQPMDTLYEKELLNEMWDKNTAKWKVWK